MKVEASFWERRRAAVEAEAEADARAQDAAENAAREAELAERDDAELLEELGLPDPESLVQGDDFTKFMAREVPERLRRKALRHLWRSNPVLACVDGLNDYDGDFTVAADTGAIKTSYQVGKGLTAHVQEMARQAEAKKIEAAQQTETVALADCQETVHGALEVPMQDDAPQDAASQHETRQDDIPQDTAAIDPDPEDLAEAMPRRMRFRFEEESA